MKSRKTIVLWLSFGGSVLMWLANQFGLADLNMVSVIPALAAGLLYIAFEAKVDIQKIKNKVSEQSNKFRDPAFWSGLISILLVHISTITGWDIPVEIIVSVLSGIMVIIFGKRYVEAKR